jgi:hypothetical protein
MKINSVMARRLQVTAVAWTIILGGCSEPEAVAAVRYDAAQGLCIAAELLDQTSKDMGTGVATPQVDRYVELLDSLSVAQEAFDRTADRLVADVTNPSRQQEYEDARRRRADAEERVRSVTTDPQFLALSVEAELLRARVTDLQSLVRIRAYEDSASNHAMSARDSLRYSRQADDLRVAGGLSSSAEWVAARSVAIRNDPLGPCIAPALDSIDAHAHQKLASLR